MYTLQREHARYFTFWASKHPICKEVCTMRNRPPEKLPDPWLFNSESLLRELDRCRELVLEISIAHPHQTHSDINIAVSALWNLRENLRYLLALHRAGQRSFARKQSQKPSLTSGGKPSGQPDVVKVRSIQA